MKILVGADPEIFMFKDGLPVSAHGAIQGTKHDPFKVKDGAVQVDGMALEFNIDPASTEEEFIHNVESVLATLKSMVPGFDLVATPVAEFGFDYIKAQPEDALLLGCDPDFDAWNDGQINPRPNGDNPFRTGAGHVHIGWTSDADVMDSSHINTGITLTKQLDAFLALPSLFYDSATKRRTMYGKAGAFRTKSYGVEYRVLSNAWLKDSKLMGWVYKNTILAVENLMGGNHVYKEMGEDILSEITNDKPNLKMVKDWLVAHNIPLPPQVA
jgi:hypothetical protein